MCECEDDLICDFAETYHVYDLYSVDVAMAARLAVGLRDYSRTKMKINGEKLTLMQTIAVLIFDKLNWIAWTKTEDGAHNHNRPVSLFETLTDSEPKEEYAEFYSGEDFKKAWNNA